MQEIKDPTIRLFGQKIREENKQKQHQDKDVVVVGELKDPQADEVTEKKNEAHPSPNAAIQNPNTLSIDEEIAKSKNGNSENGRISDANNNNSEQEKTLKKPDKLIPCPRCKSMDTKFCYYNNYNANQPRYFCKACQRYWTSGGTMRNVPVGAGRRKNKNVIAASHYRHISISEALNGTHLPTLKTNGRVLSFGFDSPISDSMDSVVQNGFHALQDERASKPCKSGENGDDCSSASSITVSNSTEETGKTAPQEPTSQQINGFLHPQVSCIPWPYQWNSPIPSPALCPPGFPIPFYHPAAFWNCGVPGNWNVPWYHPSADPNTTAPNSCPNSQTPRKHSRDGEDMVEEPPRQRKGCVLVPKTLRIDDPSEAAKSSIWATLGIKNECVGGGRGGMFKAFQSKKMEEKKSHVLWANPAALSRSLNFHENS